MSNFLVRKTAALGVIISCGLGGAQAQPDLPLACFRAEDITGWKVTPDAWSLYLRVRNGRLYRLDLADACRGLQIRGVRLRFEVRRSPDLCRASDFDLRVEGSAGAGSCVVTEVTELSPAEAVALSPSVRP